MNFTSKRLKVV